MDRWHRSFGLLPLRQICARTDRAPIGFALHNRSSWFGPGPKNSNPTIVVKNHNEILAQLPSLAIHLESGDIQGLQRLNSVRLLAARTPKFVPNEPKPKARNYENAGTNRFDDDPIA
ncbi:MAG: hypothetical protein GY949_20295 [Gammaproteobacteria bacterium]|nr:hypothetical protein [Gammaproteobacteria bacterium]